MTQVTFELTIDLISEEMEGGYNRYTSEDLPGFRILCEPQENPLPLLQEAITAFLPPMLHAASGTQNKRSNAELWRDLCEKDDRTSPEDYPDMALINEDEFMYCMEQAALSGRREADLDAALATAEAALRRTESWIAEDTDAGWTSVLRQINAALARIAEARKPRPDYL